ncbi:MAG: diaminobutyrate--2-oxoglutarate transaminase [Planctomycetales bacterium]|nr:diaminobutyrate--2-oxoglutarate transaminase [Planctomycetales bacterium]
MAIFERLESNVRGYVRSFPTVFDTADGCWLTDANGKRYLDFFAGAGTLNYGHNHPRATQAMIEYLQRGGVVHGLDTATVAKTRLLEAIDQILLEPRGYDYKVQFTGPTGTNAVEAAIKLARKSSGRSHIVAFTNAYHGHSLGALALTGNQYYHDPSYGSHNNVTHLPFDGYLGDYDTSLILEKMLADSSSGLPLPAAVILETVQGEGGINVASESWLRKIAAICRRHDIALIVDDIQVGNGRTGTFFSFEPAGIRPDIVCLSKSIGGGLPMSLLLLNPALDNWQPGQHTGTFRGNNLAFVASRALLEFWRDNHFAAQVGLRSDQLGIALHELTRRIAEERGLRLNVRGRGMVWGIDTGAEPWAVEVCRRAFELGLIIETSGANDQVIKLLPPLTITEDELGEGLRILGQAIDDAAPARSQSLSVAMPSLSEVPSPSSVNH